jgi:hypothetical protein
MMDGQENEDLLKINSENIAQKAQNSAKFTPKT